MNICLFCKKETSNPKFCSSSCAASFNNKIYPKKVKSSSTCACGIKINNNQKLCSKCKQENLLKKWHDELSPIIKSGKSSRKLAIMLGISQTTLLYRLKKCNLKLLGNKNVDNTCYYCGILLSDTRSNFCSSQHKSLYYKDNNNYYINKYNNGKNKRNFLINYFKNSCSICGYNKNSAALVFHHIEPKNKKFNITLKNCMTKSIDELQQEASKCILLCANCHAELHYPNYIL